jgi:hypothetical protein
MVSERDGHGVREGRSWCQRGTVMVLERDGHGVREGRSWC